MCRFRLSAKGWRIRVPHVINNGASVRHARSKCALKVRQKRARAGIALHTPSSLYYRDGCDTDTEPWRGD